MEPESIAVAPSPENGNVSVETEPTVPSEPTPEVPPVVEPVAPTEPVAEVLFDTPDGRKVNAETLQKEWKENFLPEFTRKSQKLAEFEKTNLPEKIPNPYENPEYVPQTYEEIIKAAEERAVKAIEDRANARIAESNALETAVAQQLEEVKKADPTVNENQLFVHATKYGFRDLKIAYQNMKDMQEMAKKVQQQTAKDIQKRQDPVSVSPGATGTKLNPEDYATSRDYLAALKGNGT